jgi:hypothetical protein
MPSLFARAPRVAATALPPSLSSNLSPSPAQAAMLREAKRLHRAATSDALSEALPVLRRLLAARAVPACPLQALFRDRASLQRKHVLRMLTFEAGHASWEAYSQALSGLDSQSVVLSVAAQRSTAILKHWFMGEQQAAQFASAHGGLVTRVGHQGAVVWPVQERQRGREGQR